MNDELTLEVRTIEITRSNIGDASMLPEILSQIPDEQNISSSTAGETYNT